MQPLLQWKSNKYYIFQVCVCSLRFPGCNVHVPYCHLRPVQLYYIFPSYLINVTIFKKKKNVIERKMCVLIFSTTFVWNISHSKKNSARYYQKSMLVFRYSACCFCQVLIKLQSPWQILKNIFKYQISWRSVRWDPISSVQKDRRRGKHGQS